MQHPASPLPTDDEIDGKDPPTITPRRGVLQALFLDRGWNAWLDAWRAIDREGERERIALSGRFDPRPLGVLVVCALVLTAEEYWGDRPMYDRLFPRLLETRYGLLGEYGWWAGAKVIGLLGTTLIAMRVCRWRAADLGLGLGDLRRHLRIYGLLLAAVLPVIVAASYTGSFQRTYPFYPLTARSWVDFLAWEGMYGLTFISVECFFRGFLLFPLRRSMGAHAIFVMAVPYCMVHFHKPVAEVVGAIFAGIILGTLALRSRSVWGGVLLHLGVAWTMDLLSLLQTSGLPGDRYIGP